MESKKINNKADASQVYIAKAPAASNLNLTNSTSLQPLHHHHKLLFFRLLSINSLLNKMQLTNLAISLFVAMVTAHPAVSERSESCYADSGLNIDIRTLKYHATVFCKGYDNGTPGPFQGHFGSNEIKNACVNNPGVGQNAGHITMSIRNLNFEQGFDIVEQDCETGLHQVIDHCSSKGSDGGVLGNGAWTFR